MQRMGTAIDGHCCAINQRKGERSALRRRWGLCAAFERQVFAYVVVSLLIPQVGPDDCHRFIHAGLDLGPPSPIFAEALANSFSNSLSDPSSRQIQEHRFIAC